MNSDVNKLIKYHRLSPHFEGGHYRETYRSTGSLEINSNERSYCTSILYLLSCVQKSRLHRIKSDEMWHIYTGNTSVKLVTIEDGQVKITKLGVDINDNQVVQAVVPAGVWFGAFIDFHDNPDQYALMGCTVSPGFDVKDYEIPGEDEIKSLLGNASADDARILEFLVGGSDGDI